MKQSPSERITQFVWLYIKMRQFENCIDANEVVACKKKSAKNVAWWKIRTMGTTVRASKLNCILFPFAWNINTFLFLFSGDCHKNQQHTAQQNNIQLNSYRLKILSHSPTLSLCLSSSFLRSLRAHWLFLLCVGVSVCVFRLPFTIRKTVSYMKDGLMKPDNNFLGNFNFRKFSCHLFM